jgi:uncharacterized protein YggT (Ycf19 family)
MKILIWTLKIYMWIIFAWVIMSWLFMVPGIPQLRNMLGVIVMPVVAPFSFLSFGGLSIAPMIPAFLLYWVIGYLENNYSTSSNAQPQIQDERRDWQDHPDERD